MSVESFSEQYKLNSILSSIFMEFSLKINVMSFAKL